MVDLENKAVDEVIKVEQRWVQAHLDLNMDVIIDILAEDYRQIQSDGSVITKDDLVASYQSGKRRWEYAHSDQYQVSIYGDVAILIGRWKGRGVNDGQVFDYSARFLAIYVQRDGDWKLVADQSTPISP